MPGERWTLPRVEKITQMDKENFRRILSRNIGLPLATGIIGSGLFLILIFYLLSALSWVEHTDQVIADSADASRLSVDLETGMRGFLITGDESFLASYETGKPRIDSDLASLRALVSDNPLQVNRLDRIAALQKDWNAFAQSMIELRRNKQNYEEAIRSGRGKRLTDSIRAEFADFSAMEKQLRLQRNASARQTTIVTVAAYVVLSLVFSGVIAWLGRRDLLGLSESYRRNERRRNPALQPCRRARWHRCPAPRNCRGSTTTATACLSRTAWCWS